MLDSRIILRYILPCEDVKIIPMSDVHFGDLYHNEKAFTDFIDKIVQNPSWKVIILGDLINNNTRSSVGSPFDDTIRPAEQKKLIAEMLMPIKDRILAVVNGTHEARSARDADDFPLYDVCSKLDIEDKFRNEAAFIKINVGERTDSPNQYYMAYNIVATHGSGSGTYPGASLNKGNNFSYTVSNADLILTGHTHKPYVYKGERLEIDDHQGMMVRQKPFTIVSASSWLDYGGYAMNKMLQPSGTCIPQIITLHANKHKEKEITVEM